MDDDARQAALPYQHTQVGFATLIGLGIGFLTQLGRAVRDVRRRRRAAWISVPLAAGFVAVMAIFSSLHVEVDQTTVVANFVGGVLRRRIPLDDIEGAEVVNIPWHRGWGMRRTRHGWLYNVWGRRAVELKLTDGSTFTIGSDQPEALLTAIEQARAQRAPAAA
jgi:hypothetical protein